MNRSVAIMAIITVVLVAAATGAKLSLPQETKCTLPDKSITCTGVKLTGNAVSFTLRNDGGETVDNVIITLSSSECKQQQQMVIELLPKEFVHAQFDCAANSGELTVLYTEDGDRQAQSGSFVIV